MTPDPALDAEVRSFVDDYRERCRWFVRADYYLSTPDEILRERPTFVEAIVRREGESVILQWTHDSAFRFFPLVAHPELGLTLHPFDLATNKVLALVGRVEARDWIDILQCDSAVQPLGY